jgi:hypothetical protein
MPCSAGMSSPGELSGVYFHYNVGQRERLRGLSLALIRTHTCLRTLIERSMYRMTPSPS